MAYYTLKQLKMKIQSQIRVQPTQTHTKGVVHNITINGYSFSSTSSFESCIEITQLYTRF